MLWPGSTFTDRIDDIRMMLPRFCSTIGLAQARAADAKRSFEAQLDHAIEFLVAVVEETLAQVDQSRRGEDDVEAAMIADHRGNHRSSTAAACCAHRFWCSDELLPPPER